MSTCAKCGAEFTDGSKYRPRKYCYSCAPRVIHERRKPYKHICHVCGSEYTANNYSLYCSDVCRVEANRRRWRKRYVPKPRQRHNVPRQNVCECCGAEFTAGRKARWCPDCHYTGRYKVMVYTPRTCPTCGYVFPKMHRTCPTCSPPAQKKRWKISDTRRRAIYERDNWTCWLCGEPVDTSDDPRSGLWYPTLDHIVPRVLGGDHSDDNLKCAHRTCNSSRGCAAA